MVGIEESLELTHCSRKIVTRESISLSMCSASFFFLLVLRMIEAGVCGLTGSSINYSNSKMFLFCFSFFSYTSFIATHFGGLLNVMMVNCGS